MSDIHSQSSSAAPVADGQPPDPLATLYHMSTTAGLTSGAREYVAINACAIASFILGFASVLVFLSDVLLVIPLAAFICGVMAVVQIRGSNQTQTGMPLAVLGLLLSIGIGGGRAGYEVLRHYHASADEKEIAQLMQQFGQDLASDQYDKAYALCNDRFRQRVRLADFDNAFRSWRSIGGTGALKGIEWNREPMLFEEEPDTDITVASAMAFFHVSQDTNPRRAVISFEKSSGQWRIHGIEAIFPSKKQTPQ